MTSPADTPEDTHREDTGLEAAILQQVESCGQGKSLSPSDVAMAMGPDWRTKLSAVRRAAIRLAASGRIEILRKGRPVDPVGVKGVIRLRLRAETDDAA